MNNPDTITDIFNKPIQDIDKACQKNPQYMNTIYTKLNQQIEKVYDENKLDETYK